MDLPFRDALIPRLRTAFPGMPLHVGEGSEPLVRIPAKHPDVGDVVILDDGDELRVSVGRLTHSHFGLDGSGLTPTERAGFIAGDVVGFLRKVFADEIEFYGNERGGGARERSRGKRGSLSKVFFGRKSYVWSGPLDPPDS